MLTIIDCILLPILLVQLVLIFSAFLFLPVVILRNAISNEENEENEKSDELSSDHENVKSFQPESNENVIYKLKEESKESKNVDDISQINKEDVKEELRVVIPKIDEDNGIKIDYKSPFGTDQNSNGWMDVKKNDYTIFTEK